MLTGWIRWQQGIGNPRAGRRDYSAPPLPPPPAVEQGAGATVKLALPPLASNTGVREDYHAMDTGMPRQSWRRKLASGEVKRLCSRHQRETVSGGRHVHACGGSTPVLVFLSLVRGAGAPKSFVSHEIALRIREQLRGLRSRNGESGDLFPPRKTKHRWQARAGNVSDCPRDEMRNGVIHEHQETGHLRRSLRLRLRAPGVSSVPPETSEQCPLPSPDRFASANASVGDGTPNHVSGLTSCGVGRHVLARRVSSAAYRLGCSG